MDTTVIITIVVSVIASTGFWQFLINWYNNKHAKMDATTKMLLGIANKMISESCQEYINRGYITKEEYDDLKKYLCDPYFELGGDGTVERLFKEVDQMPIK